MDAGKILVGLRAEDKSYWERRTPLPPHDCEAIMKKHPRIQFIVQPSTKRIFTNQQYREVGCIVQDDLSKCVVIVCIKEIPLEKYIPGMTYIHWSHTIKGQPQNMPALDKMLELGVRHLDYEKILNDKGVNITAFPYAGIAGVITFFNEFGKLLLKKNLNTPFLQIGPTYQYYQKADAYRALQETGEVIKKRGIPKEIGLPLIFGVLGSNGLCGRGSMEALSNLPITIIKPEEMKALVQDKDNLKHRFTIYVVPFQTTDLVRFTEDYDKPFTSKDYYEHPQQFTPIFHSKYLQYLSTIIVDVYWDTKFPRYVTSTQMRELVEAGKSRLHAICDVTCDLEGCIQFLKKYTTPDDPVYYYDPISEAIHDKFDPQNPQHLMYMAIDFLPSQLPYDASLDFGKALREIVPEIAFSDATKPLAESGLPQYLQDATITLHGQLTPKFQYITHLRNFNEALSHAQNFEPKKAMKKIPSYMAIKLSGHLFDTGAINKLLDILQHGGCKFNIVDVQVGQNQQETSHMQLQLFSKDKGTLMDELARIQQKAEEFGIQIDLGY